MRVLGRIRLSRFRGLEDVTTSPERQKLNIKRWAKSNGHKIIGWATDLDLGRSVDPLEAPDLGKWFHDPQRIDSWDIIAGYRLDRIATGSIYLSKVMEWCQERGKSIVSTSETFDLSSGPGRMIAFILAEVAAGELEAIRERTTDTFDFNYSLGKYRGGAVPYGYKIENGVYAIDRYAHKVLNEIIDRIIDKQSIRSVRMWLNDSGIPSPSDQRRINNGEKPKGSPWRDTPLKDMLKSEAMLGYAIRRDAVLGADGNPVRDKKGNKNYGEFYAVRDESGAPVKRAKGLVTRTRFDELQAALGENIRSAPKRRKTQTPLLLQVGFCSGLRGNGTCGTPLDRSITSRGVFRYRCRSVGSGIGSCGTLSATAESAEQALQEVLLESFGTLPMRKRIYVPGTDNTNELAEIEAELDSIAGLVGTPAFRGKALDRLNNRIEALDARRSELEASPVVAPGYRYEDTGQTFSEAWEAMTVDERNSFLRQSKVRAEWNGVDWRYDLTHLDRLLSGIDPQLSAEDFLQEISAEQAANRAALGIALD